MTKEAAQKIEDFIKTALAEIDQLKQQVEVYQTKQASAQSNDTRELDSALKKAAEAMYNSDFILDEDEKRTFVKKAKADAKYLAKELERVCNASDVAYMGKVASVKSGNSEVDPVMRRAFGYDDTYNLMDNE